MRYVLRLLLVTALCVLCALCGKSAAYAKDHFLTIGGGYSPSGNQVSLEKNVNFLQSVLAEKRPDQPPHDVYFADGDDDQRDVHYRDPDFETTCPPARRIMAELFGDSDSMDHVYRNHEIKNVAGPADKDLLETRFRELARELQSGDRLIVYATGHGGPASAGHGGRRRGGGPRGGGRGRGNPYNTTLYLWDNARVSASDFAGWLNDLRPDVTVVLVMVQCHAGGFAHTIFEQATASQGLAPHARCGFFAQVHDRAASGCTPDVEEADYQEYSSFFWAALAGRTRAGAKLSGVDYDRNGEVSFSEAHAYAVLASDTIDIPVRTSDALLRQYSRAEGSTAGTPATETGGPRRGGRGRRAATTEEPVEPEQPQTPAASSDLPADLTPFAGPLSKLTAIARPDQRAILEQLPVRLGLGGAATVEDVRRRLEKANSEIDALNGQLSDATQKNTAALTKVREEVRRIWPELNSDYAPLAMSLANERADEFAPRVSGMASYRDFTSAHAAQEVVADARLDAERMEAKVQRLLRTCEDVVLAANLPKVATPEIVARYEKLVEL
ncbi:MAG: hypothetical protein WD669_13150, partial [Pirellulales bacterium]